MQRCQSEAPGDDITGVAGSGSWKQINYNSPGNKSARYKLAPQQFQSKNLLGLHNKWVER